MTLTGPAGVGHADVAPARPARAARPSRLVVTVLVVGAMIALALRFVARSPLWLDEAQSVAIARLPLGDLLSAIREDGAPPLYYVILHVWLGWFGEGAAAVRALSGVFGAAAVPVAWLVGRRLGGPRVAWPAAALLAGSPFALRYSTEARMYALVILLVLVGYLALLRAEEQPTTARLAAVAAATGALVLTHYWALYLVAALSAVLVVRARRDRSGPAGWVLAAVAFGALAFVPWLPSFWFQVRHTGAPWAWRPGLGDVLEAFGRYGGERTGGATLLCLLLAGLVALGVLGRGMGDGRVELRWRGRPLTRPLAVVVLATVTLALVAGRLGLGPVTARYTAVVFPLVVLLAAVGLAQLGRRGAVAVTGITVAAGLLLGGQAVTAARTQVPQVARAIADDAERRDIVVYCPDQLGPSTSRLLPPTVRQVTYPDLASPERVNWVDYRERFDNSAPSMFAWDLERTVGRGDIWLVTSPSYVTLGGTCNRLAEAFEALRPDGREVVSPDGEVFEQARLQRFRP